MNTAQLNSLSYRVIGAAIAVHRELGPGLEELDYELALSAELTAAEIVHVCQQSLPIVYKGVRLDLLNFGEKQLSQGIRRLSNPSWRRG